MTEFTSEQRQDILAALKSAHVHEQCPRCRNMEFILLDGYANFTISPDVVPTFFLGGPTIPTVVTVCMRCGFIAHHAVGALGVQLPQEVEQNAGRAG